MGGGSGSAAAEKSAAVVRADNAAREGDSKGGGRNCREKGHIQKRETDPPFASGLARRMTRRKRGLKSGTNGKREKANRRRIQKEKRNWEKAESAPGGKQNDPRKNDGAASK